MVQVTCCLLYLNSFTSSRGGLQEDTDRLDCDAQVQPLLLSETQTTTVRYTYRITWDVSTISMF